MCFCGPQEERPKCEKHQFYMEMPCNWDLQNPGKIVLGLVDFNGHVVGQINDFDSVHGADRIGKRNVEERKIT